MSEHLDDLISGLEQAEEPTETEEAVIEQPEVEVEAKETPQEKSVPIAALHEARQQNRELREQMNRLTERVGAVDELRAQMETLRNARNAPPVVEETPPDFQDDPKGYIDRRLTQIESLAKEAKTSTDENIRQSSEQLQISTINQRVQSDHQEFVAKTPAYLEALKFMRESRIEELTDLGLNEVQARQKLNVEEQELAILALHGGKSPAEKAYARAVRMGFNAAEAAKAATAAVVPDAEDAESMGGGGRPSVQDLLEADDDAFDKAFQELGFGKQMK